MKIFVFEHITGGGMAGTQLPGSLRREGWAMLRSIVEDLAGVNEAERIAVTLDPRLEGLRSQLPSRRVEAVLAGEGEVEAAFERLARECGTVLVIAPELGGALLAWTLRAERAGARLLGSPSAAVELAGDKVALAERLAARGVPVVPHRAVDLEDGPPEGILWPAVLKPRHGAGSSWTYLVPDRTGATRIFSEAAREGAPRALAIAPYEPGLAASASFLSGPGGHTPLLAGEQLLSDDGRFRYLGGRMPLGAGLAARAVRLAARALEAVEGIRGFSGVDLVLDLDPSTDEEPRDLVIEVNPRPTTSYAGLRALALDNLAGLWLSTLSGVDVAPPRWYGGALSFTPEGVATRDR